MTDPPRTLGEKLARVDAPMPSPPEGVGVHVAYVLANTVILTGLTVLPLVWMHFPMFDGLVFAMMLGLLALWGLTCWIGPRPAKLPEPQPQPVHFLLANDKKGVLGPLRLDTKTAVFDGSNIYHFGVDNNLGTMPVHLIAQQLRAEGYRVVCFFDANIFYTMIDTDAYPAGERHSLTRLQKAFGLTQGEVYVVPSGVQADDYILSLLNHMPKSFAVSNDRFRQFAKTYPNVMKGNLWRKGVTLKGNELKLSQHRFKTAVKLPTDA